MLKRYSVVVINYGHRQAKSFKNLSTAKAYAQQHYDTTGYRSYIEDLKSSDFWLVKDGKFVYEDLAKC